VVLRWMPGRPRPVTEPVTEPATEPAAEAAADREHEAELAIMEREMLQTAEREA